MDFIINPGAPNSGQGQGNGKGNGQNAGKGAGMGGTAGNSADPVKNSDMQHFVADVIEASKDVPVIVDFWAPWCGPCKQLGPMLEKLVRQMNGMVRMVKVNVDENQQLAAQLQIQSIPTVYAFKDGRPVDAFMGALPESQLKTFIDRLLGDAKSPIAEALEHAKAMLDAGDVAGATDVYAQVLAADGENAEAAGGLIRAYAAAGDFEQARGIAQSLTPAMQMKAEVTAALSALDLAEQMQGAGKADDAEIAALKTSVDQNPKDMNARLNLANALYAKRLNEQAVDTLIEMVRIDRKWNDEAARKQLVKIFDALGNTDPITQEGRRRLSSVLFS